MTSVCVSADTQDVKVGSVKTIVTNFAAKNHKTEGSFIVLNDRGIHTRPSTEIVKCASLYNSDITLKYQKSEANAKSILGVLMLAAPKGAKISIIAEGEDAEEAVSSLLELAKNQFGMKY